ncbi:MAG TPA: phospholipase D-like domain-containing protein [Steroidobacteraceae bacterium]|jgi:hypothetical protein|nr:phospholipase D-like domain-containing protein [Steroidobacteraceae bacterium]
MSEPKPLAGSPAKSPAVGTARSSFTRCVKMILLVLLLAWLSLAFWNSAKPLPAGTHVVSQVSRLSEADVDFLYVSTRREYASAQDTSAIDHAEHLIVLDRSPVTPELARHLLARKRLRPNLKMVLVTDPGNEVFGGTPSQTLISLERAGVIVARVRLDSLRDSNPLYSGLWRLAFSWWSNPFDETPGQVSLPAWSRMQNSKSDRRQLVVADDGSGGWTAIIAPADAAASLVLRGSLAQAMIADELQVAAWSTDDDRLPRGPPSDAGRVGSIDARFLTEGAIEGALLDAMAAAGSGDQISVAVEKLSDRRLITAALSAAARGARLQVLLARFTMPNQTVAGELLRDGGGHIELRWYPDERGASHPTLLMMRHREDVWVNLGTANFTRRDLGDLNLAASVELRMPARAAPARAIADYFAGIWSGASADAGFVDESAAAYWRYRFAEATGLSSF